MKLNFSNRLSKNGVLIYPVFALSGGKNKKQKVSPSGPPALARLLPKLKQLKEFEGKEGQTFFLYNAGGGLPDRIVLVGFGDLKKLTASSVMSALGSAVKLAKSHRSQKISLILTPQLHAFSQSIGEAVVLANYSPGLAYKTGKTLKKLTEQSVENLEVVGLGKNEAARKALRKGLAMADAVNGVRDWVNAPPNFANMQFFVAKAEEIAKETGAKLTILGKKELEKLNMGALLAVNRGSNDEARLIILDYHPKDAKEPPFIFAGKGILFDSGGYNLKPGGHIEDMQLDKAGAAAVLALIKMLPIFDIKRRVIAIAPFTENLIGQNAVKPSEIVKTYSGKTVEITNTDAEGRLVLCDAIAYAIDQFKPKLLVDLATLTGACVVALGERYAGLFGNDEELMKQLRAAGEEVDELLWPMPIHKDDGEKMKGQYADLRNHDTGSAREAGASKGAAFLQEFVGKTKWAHLDIAGPAFTSDPKKYDYKGATGFGVRVLVRFLEKITNF